MREKLYLVDDINFCKEIWLMKNILKLTKFSIHLLKSDCKLSEVQSTIPCLFPAFIVTIINIIAFQMKIIGFNRRILEN